MSKFASPILADREPSEADWPRTGWFARLMCAIGGHRRCVFTGELTVDGREMACLCGKVRGGIDWR